MNIQLDNAIKKTPLLSQLQPSEIHIQPLAGLTNKNYLLSIADKQYVLRIPQESTNRYINRNNEVHNAKIAQQLEVAPKILWQEKYQGQLTGLSLSHYVAKSQPISANDRQMLEKLAKTLRKLHSSKVSFKGLLDHKTISKQISLYFKSCSIKHQKQFNTDYQETLSLLKQIGKSDHSFVPSHVDLVKENILIKKENIWIIDWEYSAMASPFWDIATFCNAASFSENNANYFLEIILGRAQENDKKLLNMYRKITKTMTNCWKSPLTLKEKTNEISL